MGKKNKLYQYFAVKTNPLFWGTMGSLIGIILVGIKVFKATHSIWWTMLGCLGGLYAGMFGVALLCFIFYIFIFMLPRRLGYNVDGELTDPDYGKKIL